MALEAGKLRHRVELQKKVTTLDTSGQQVEDPDFTTFATVWGSVVPMSAREFVASEKTQSEVRARITIRYRADIDSTVRIKHGTTIYNIEGVLADPDSGREYLTLVVSAGLSAG